MASNHSSYFYHDLAKANPGKVGWLLGPSSWKNPREHMPYALDNDAYTSWTSGIPWDESAWFKMMDKAVKFFKPLWSLVPDVVANREATIEKWHRYSPEVIVRGFQLAFALQDGMTPHDVPKNADVVFVGGTTSWKWRTLPIWCAHFPRVHVGRVRIGKLEVAERCGAESVDGTGFFRESHKGKPARQMTNFVQGHRNTNLELFNRMENREYRLLTFKP